MQQGLTLKNPIVVIGAYILIVISMFCLGAVYYIKSLEFHVATETARSFDASLVTIQNYYSNEIVPRARKAGVTLSHKYHDMEASIPFPATFTIDVGKQFEKTVPGMMASLYSDQPFPWRKDRKLDQFEQDALQFLSENPDQSFVGVEEKNGQPALRYASAVILSQSCVDCHNLPEYRFGKKWEVGDFRGVREVSVPLSKMANPGQEFYLVTGGFILIAAFIGAAIVFPLVVRLNGTLAQSRTLASQLEAKNYELEKQSRAKDQFLANMSHELRTPLNAILGFSDIIRQSMFGPIGNDKYIGYANDIHRGGVHLTSMIEDLLDLARIEQGELPLNEEEIDLGNLWRDVESMVIDAVRHADMSLNATIADGLPMLRGDARAIRQMMINLVMNAVHHSGGQHILITLSEDEGRIVFTVQDDGIGIQPEEIKNLRTKFYRGTSADHMARGGLGIGLTIVDTFAGVHGAEMEIDSSASNGAAFIIRFPADRTVRH